MKTTKRRWHTNAFAVLDLFEDRTVSLLNVFLYGVSPVPAFALVERFQGDRMVVAAAGEAAVRIGSTPLSRIITCDGESAAPSVATIISASPFCNWLTVTAGMRFSIC